jgi:hypothetical protein
MTEKPKLELVPEEPCMDWGVPPPNEDPEPCPKCQSDDIRQLTVETIRPVGARSGMYCHACKWMLDAKSWVCFNPALADPAEVRARAVQWWNLRCLKEAEDD